MVRIFFLFELLFCMKQHHFPFVAVEMHLFLISENKTYIHTQLDWTSRNFQINFEFGFGFFLICLWIERSTTTKLQLDIESHGGVDRKLQLTTLTTYASWKKMRNDSMYLSHYTVSIVFTMHLMCCQRCVQWQYLERYFACPLNLNNYLNFLPTIHHEFEALKYFFLPKSS